MNRLIVALLAALDAIIQAAVGLAVVAAALTVLWAVGLGGAADWSILWPAIAAVWQLGHLVPLDVQLPLELLTATGLPSAAAGFTLSLAPLGFAVFAVTFGIRSGARAVRAGAWPVAVGSAAVVSTAIAAGVATTSRLELVEAPLWLAILLPAAIYTGAVLVGAVVVAWRDGDEGIVDLLHDRVDDASDIASDVIAVVGRGAAVVVTGVVGFAALGVVLALVLRGGQVMALFQASNVDAVGAVVLGLAQVAYLPTLIVWALSWIAGPGFAVGAGTVVGPAGTDLGVVPAIPVLGALPELSNPWFLLVALIPVAAGAFAGWMARSHLVHIVDGPHEPVLPRVVAAVGIAVLSSLIVAGLVVAASGSMGPGALSAVGPNPGPVSLAIGLEALIGASILLLGPRAGDSAPRA